MGSWHCNAVFSIFFSRACGLVLCLFLMASLLRGAAAAASGSGVRAMYVLGDSQADAGNNNYLLVSLLRANFPHNGVDYPGRKATGRFSNGYNFVDFLAANLELASPPPYLSICNTSSSNPVYLNGVNFASGGAGGQCISFDEQIDRDYSSVRAALVQQLGEATASAHLAGSIFAVAIGGNDIINRVQLPGAAAAVIASSQQFISSLAQTLKLQLLRMYGLGMRRLFLVGAPPLGCLPLLRERSLTKECDAEANYLSVQYNVAVASLLREMGEQHADMRYSFFDTYTALLHYIQEPEANGFSEVKASCCGLGNNNAIFLCTPASSYCMNRTSHIFWDVVHPTDITAKKLSTIAFNGPSPLVAPLNIRQLSTM